MTDTNMFLTETLKGSYDYRLVAFSVLIATLASFAALDLAGRVTAARGRSRLIWLTGGAFAMGLGIWSMHYIGMLAYSLPVAVYYDWPTVLVSLLAAVFASGVALFVVSREQMVVLSAGVGGVVMGLGIAAMHYIGMEAMRLSRHVPLFPGLVILSVILAIVISLVALVADVPFAGRERRQGLAKTGQRNFDGGGHPSNALHRHGRGYFYADGYGPGTDTLAGNIRLGIAAIIIVTLMVLGMTILTSLVDRRFSAQSLELNLSEQRYRQLVESAQVILWRRNVDSAEFSFRQQ